MAAARVWVVIIRGYSKHHAMWCRIQEFVPEADFIHRISRFFIYNEQSSHPMIFVKEEKYERKSQTDRNDE